MPHNSKELSFDMRSRLLDDKDHFVVRVVRRDDELVSLEVNLDGLTDRQGDDSGPDDKYAKRFAALSSSWTSTAIGFFEFVPTIGDFGFFFAEHDFQEKGETLISRCATDTAERELDERGREWLYKIHRRETAQVVRAVRNQSRILKSANLFRRSALTSLISEYEAFIFDLAKLAVAIRPEVFLNKEASLPLSDIDKCETISDLKKNFVRSRLEATLHNKSHHEVLVWLGDTFGVNLVSDQRLIGDFVEICQRRHLISHSGSKVNSRYIEICRKLDVPPENVLDEGETVVVEWRYFRRATARVYQVGFFTLHLIWQKLLKQTEQSDGAVLQASHEFLEHDLTKMARRILRFPLSRTKDRPTGRAEAYLRINEAQSYFFDPDLDEGEKEKKTEKILGMRDWSETSPVVELALHCLRRNFGDIGKLVVAAAASHKRPLTYEDVFTWNIFREARENPEFMAGVRQAFGDVGQIASDGSKALPPPNQSS